MLAFCLDDEQPARSVVCKDKDEKEGSINTLALMGHVLCFRVCLPYSGNMASNHLWRHFRRVQSSHNENRDHPATHILKGQG